MEINTDLHTFKVEVIEENNVLSVYGSQTLESNSRHYNTKTLKYPFKSWVFDVYLKLGGPNTYDDR